jgi:hypothetical protein
MGVGLWPFAHIAADRREIYQWRVQNKNIIERAFELASSGNVQNLMQLELVLKREGYEATAQHLAGSSLRKQLRHRIDLHAAL